ncbi:phospholipid scramblase 1-like isoform X2 [Rhinoraja longicauda]
MAGQGPYVPQGSSAFSPMHPVAWMQAPAPIPNCPPGLEYLTMIDQIFVHQLIEFIEALSGFETKNKYELKNSMGQRVYFAIEESECCNRLCCGANRAFTIKILDNLGQTVMHLVRPLGCQSCWFPCCHHRMEVQAPPGTTIGFVVQEWNPCIPNLSIQNEMSETILKIKGPCCTFNCCGDVNFKVLSMDETNVIGKISKKWSGLLREYFTDADNFGIQFPMDLDVKVKAVLIGACIMVDFLYFEQNSGTMNQGGWQMM